MFDNPFLVCEPLPCNDAVEIVIRPLNIVFPHVLFSGGVFVS